MTTEHRLDQVFSALADRTRRAILTRLARGVASVAQLAKPFAISQPAVSKHLKVLERSGLITRERAAQKRPCRIVGKPLTEAGNWIEHHLHALEKNSQRSDVMQKERQQLSTKPRKK
jgi:DNA-binding transcriptional ArsR family regulator